MLEVILVTIFIAITLNIFLISFQIPTIIWYIITWVLLNLIFSFENIWLSEELKMMAEFWIVFLMFNIWLEFSLKHLMKMKKYVFLHWSLQFLFTSIFFFSISHYLFFIDIKASILISSWLTLSSTAIVLKILNDTKEINKRYWQKALWILLFQDLMVIPILLLISIFEQKDTNILRELIKTFIDSVTLLTILWLFWKYILDTFLEKVHKTNSNEIFTWTILLIIIGSSYFSHYLWLSYSIWAFIAWIMISETSFKYKIESWLIPFKNLLLGIFFVTVWMQINFQIIYDNYLLIICLILGLIIFKTLILFLILIFSTPKTTALKTAIALFQVWEFAIIIFELAEKWNIFSHYLAQILIIITILSMILTPFVLKYLDLIVSRFIKTRYTEFTNIKELKDHIVIIWYGRIWSMVSDFLDENNQEHIIIDNNLDSFSIAKINWKRVILWDALDENILENVSITKASHIIVLVWSSDNTQPIIQILLNLVDKEKIILKVSKYSDKESFLKYKIPHILVETEKTAKTIIDYIK